ncbi:MAG: LCP family protein [Eubacteriales bacterium]|nr:LCP family protein [Eubacteriales bacterium]
MKLFGGKSHKKHSEDQIVSQYTTNSVELDEPTVRFDISGADSTAGEQTASAGSLPTETDTDSFVAVKQKKKRRTLLIVLCCAFALILGAVAAIWAWIDDPDVNQEGLLTQTPGLVYDSPEPSEEPVAEPDPTEEPVEEKTGRKPGTYTVLCMAKDDAGLNTDTMMMVKLDTEEGTLDIVSIPRDILVDVPWGTKKINTMYGGAEGVPNLDRAKEYMADVLGFPVDNAIVVDIRAFIQLVDAVGGIYYDVPRPMDYDDPSQNLSIHIPAGPQLLNGQNALHVVRFRVGNNGTGYANGDLGRIETQQDFLMTVANQMLTLGNIPNLPTLYQIVRDNVNTDLTDNNLAFFAQEFLKLDKENVRFHTAPVDMGGAIIGGIAYISLIVDEWIEMVNAYLNPFYEEVTTANVSILTSDGTTLSSTTGVVPSWDSFTRLG